MPSTLRGGVQRLHQRHRSRRFNHGFVRCERAPLTRLPKPSPGSCPTGIRFSRVRHNFAAHGRALAAARIGGLLES
jgi:hypothetical protein